MSTSHRHHLVGHVSHHSNHRRLRRSAMAVCIAALLSTGVHAQESTTSSAGNQDAKELDAVVVTGIRGAIMRAQDIKRDADTFVDSVTAQDIGALPDRSVTETLSRIPGVTIDRFLSVGDPEHFSAEGNGVQVRGLTHVRSELNGRDSFSASGGRGLSFQDVPSELMAGVDVYKNQTAAMIEGGLGGTVDLRTRLPFDFEGSKLATSFSVNQGDFADKIKPSASVLYSNRWDTDAGQFGILVDVASSGLATRTDGLFVRPFFKNSNADLNGDNVNDEVWLPRGGDWRTLQYDRDRTGAYLALQWRPNDDIEVVATAFQSKYEELWYEDAIFVNNDPTQVSIDASQPYELAGNVFRSGRLTMPNGVPMGTDIRASNRDSKTSDYSVGLKWVFSDRTTFTTDLQYVKADTQKLDSTVALGVDLPYIDVTLGGVPSISVNDQFTANPANYYWAFTMENLVDNVADQVAWRADIQHSLDGGFFKGLKAGVRLTERDATSRDTSYNWQPVFQPWMRWWALPGEGPMPPLDLNGTVNSSLVNLNTFNNFYRGGAGTPGSFYAPVLSTALGFPDSYTAIHTAAAPFYWCCYGTFTPRSLDDPPYTNIQEESTQAVYVMANFGLDEVLLDGNFGVRVVRTSNSASGYRLYPNRPYAPFLGAGEFEKLPVAENSYTDVLPSVNVRWEPKDNLILRFAASKAITRPGFDDLKAFQELKADTKPGIDPPSDGSPLPIESLNLTGEWNNPFLKPMKANQYDLSLEWYFDQDHGGMAWVNLFHKDIKDYFRRQSELIEFPGADGNQYEYLVNRPVNIGKARITGAEIGWNQFFTFLPGPFDGLGMSANYTYIDSSTQLPNNPNLIPTDTDGAYLGGNLPADGLSEHSYNVAAFYEKGPWQVRFAYNWRSEYLLAVGPNGYNGTDGGVAWKLPVYSDDYGQLDGSVFYRFSDNVQIGLEMNNLNNAEQRTIMEQGAAGRHVTSWFVNDRRYAATIRFTF